MGELELIGFAQRPQPLSVEDECVGERSGEIVCGELERELVVDFVDFFADEAGRLELEVGVPKGGGRM